MVRYSCILFLLSIRTPWATGYDGTTTFDSILLAHSSPTICPSPKDFDSYIPDASYIACCNHWFGPHTLTTGVGPGAQPVYACCMSGYTCTAPVSLMKDWSVDSNGDLQTRDLANAPAPTASTFCLLIMNNHLYSSLLLELMKTDIEQCQLQPSPLPLPHTAQGHSPDPAPPLSPPALASSSTYPTPTPTPMITPMVATAPLRPASSQVSRWLAPSSWLLLPS